MLLTNSYPDAMTGRSTHSDMTSDATSMEKVAASLGALAINSKQQEDAAKAATTQEPAPSEAAAAGGAAASQQVPDVAKVPRAVDNTQAMILETMRKAQEAIKSVRTFDDKWKDFQDRYATP